MKIAHMAAFLLVIVGAVNWGLQGLGGFMNSNWNLVNLALGSMPQAEWVVYILVGAAGVYLAFTHKKDCKACSGKM